MKLWEQFCVCELFNCFIMHEAISSCFLALISRPPCPPSAKVAEFCDSDVAANFYHFAHPFHIPFFYSYNSQTTIRMKLHVDCRFNGKRPVLTQNFCFSGLLTEGTVGKLGSKDGFQTINFQLTFLFPFLLLSHTANKTEGKVSSSPELLFIGTTKELCDGLICLFTQFATSSEPSGKLAQ